MSDETTSENRCGSCSQHERIAVLQEELEGAFDGLISWPAGAAPAVFYLGTVDDMVYRLDVPYPNTPVMDDRERAIARALLNQALAALDLGDEEDAAHR